MENKIQGDFHKKLWNKYPRTRGLCYHIPNGGKRSAVEASQFKAIGVLAGIPDYHIAIPARGYASLYIEFKTDTGTLSDIQVKRIETLRGAGNLVVICRSADQALAEVEKYLENTEYLVPNWRIND